MIAIINTEHFTSCGLKELYSTSIRSRNIMMFNSRYNYHINSALDENFYSELNGKTYTEYKIYDYPL